MMFIHLLLNEPVILLIIILIGFMAGVIKGIVGFALPMILITGLSIFIPIEQALASLILPTIITNFIQSFTISKSTFFSTIVNYKTFLFFSSIFLIVSSQFYSIFSAELIMGFVGIILFAYTFSQILGFQFKFKNNGLLTVITGSINGVLGGIAGIWGPLTVSYLISLKIEAGTFGPQIADLSLEIDNKEISSVSEGSGPVDAIFNAIKNLFPHNADLQLYQVHAVTQGTDAQAEVSVRLHEDGKTVVGRGADTDTLVASARAYIAALNRLIIKREKNNPN